MRRLLYLDNLKVCLTVTLRVHLLRTAVAVPRMWKLEEQILEVVCCSGLWSVHRPSAVDARFTACG